MTGSAPTVQDPAREAPPGQVLVRPPDPGSSASWADYGWHTAPSAAGLAADYRSLKSALERAGTTVVELPPGVPGDPDAIYLRDPVLVVPQGVVLLRTGKPGRRAEPRAMAGELQSLGAPILGSLQGSETAEGGDMFLLDQGTLLVGRSYRTNDQGIAGLRRLLPQLEVIAFDLPHHHGAAEVLHLMSLISPLSPSLVVGYLPLLPARLVQLLEQRGIELIPVPEEEFSSMGANVLGLPGGRAVVLEGSPETRRRLLSAGLAVELYSGQELSLNGDGGPTCLTLPWPAT